MKKNRPFKLLGAIFICCLITLNSNFAYATYAYNSEWSAQAISNFLKNEIDILSMMNDEREIDDPITRDVLSRLIVELYAKSNNLDKESIQITDNPFTDTTSSDALRVYSLGIMQGVAQNTFAPDDYITREQLATIITRLLNKKNINTDTTQSLNNYTDKDSVSPWAFASLSYCVEKQIIQGSENRLLPADFTTMEQAVTILDRVAVQNNWLVESKDIYLYGFFLPNDSELIIDYGGGNHFALLIDLDNIKNTEKLKADIHYMFHSKFTESDQQITGILNAVERLEKTNGRVWNSFEFWDNNERFYIIVERRDNETISNIEVFETTDMDLLTIPSPR